MSSPPKDDAPVRSERPKLNLKPRDEGAAAKLATERAGAAKSVSDGHSKRESKVFEPPAREMQNRHSLSGVCFPECERELVPDVANAISLIRLKWKNRKQAAGRARIQEGGGGNCR